MTEAELEYVGYNIPAVKIAHGCTHCNGTGYSGRISIHEILLVDKQVRNMISSGATTEMLKEYAIANQGMKTLRQSCLELVSQGVTTMDEFRRVAYND